MAKLERLDKVLSNMGYGSRKDVKSFIKKGFVKINGNIVTDNTIKLDPYKDTIHFKDEVVNYREFIYLMMNKLDGLVSSTDDPLTKTVIDLLSPEYLIYEPFPAGRLDKDTEGLLLITNDGQLAHQLLSPKKGVNKVYYVEVDGYVDESYKEQFKSGIILDDGYKTLPADLEIIKSDVISKVNLTIQEGKYHQVKRMFESISMKVTYLKRISMGPLNLDSELEPGEYRELTEDEINLLKQC
ncbi:MAG: pseudouridine synthase [Tissierellaceae bacterium]|nr:pseudouridine synthase [Tissierellaceae bacterium]